LVWDEDEERLFVFLRSVCPEFFCAQGVAKNRLGLKWFAAKKKALCAVPAAA